MEWMPIALEGVKNTGIAELLEDMDQYGCV